MTGAQSGAQNPIWVSQVYSGTQAFGSSSAAFPGLLAGNRVGSGAGRIETGSQTGNQCYQWGLNPLCHVTAANYPSFTKTLRHSQESDLSEDIGCKTRGLIPGIAKRWTCFFQRFLLTCYSPLDSRWGRKENLSKHWHNSCPSGLTIQPWETEPKEDGNKCKIVVVPRICSSRTASRDMLWFYLYFTMTRFLF